MPNPYELLAQIGGLFGVDEVEQIGRAGSRGQRAVQRRGDSVARGATNLLRSSTSQPNTPRTTGLPPVNMAGKPKGFGSTHGATRTTPAPLKEARHINLPNFGMLDVQGMPSVRVVPLASGEVATTITLKSLYVEGFTREERREVERIVRAMERDARRLSRGRLSTKRLRKMNHPYGHGAYAPSVERTNKAGRRYMKKRKRRAIPKTLASKRFRQQGVGSMAVVNRQTGYFEKSWHHSIDWKPNSATISLLNFAEYASYLATGTRGRLTKSGDRRIGGMKAHGPFATAPALHLAELHRVWKKNARQSYLRDMALRKPNDRNTQPNR